MQQRRPVAYLPTQIVLHWTVAVLVILQVLLHEGMEEAWKAYEDGEGTSYNPLAVVHIAIGFTILLLALWRIALRVRHGAPPLPESHPAALKFVAHANHYLLYAFLIGMPLTGASAWFLGMEGAADIHETAKTILLVLVGLHIAGALAEHFLLKSNVLRRMLGVST